MSVRYPLRLFFDCSTAHLSPASRVWLDHHVRARDKMLAATPYGWFIWCGGNDDSDLPADLAEVMAHARSQDADYILFDADAEECAALPTFDWSG